MSVDLPALGKPTRPTSARSFSSRRRSFSSPGSPGWTLRGARLVDVAKCALPRPPRPPRAAGAVVFEPDTSGDLREDRVVLAETRVEPRAETASALPHDDGAAADDVAVVRFHAEPLRVRVAAVA